MSAAASQRPQKEGDPLPPMGLSLEQHDAPWLEERLWGLAEEISEAFCDAARCTRSVNAIARGKKRFTPQNVDELRRLVEEDLMPHRTALPGSYRDAYDEISRGFDVPSKITTTAPASVRRAVARQIQRDRLRGDVSPQCQVTQGQKSKPGSVSSSPSASFQSILVRTA